MTKSAAAWALVAFVGYCSAVAVAADPPTTQPTADELIRLVPKVSLNDPLFKTFHLNMEVRAGKMNGQKWEIFYERPDRFSFLMSDLKDGTPYVMMVNEKVLLYDAIQQTVILGRADANSIQIVNRAGNHLDFHWVFDATPTNDLEIDVNSFFSGIACTVSGERDGTFKLSGVSTKGTEIVAYIDRSKPCPCTRLELGAGEKEPILRFDLAANETTPAFAWRFPTSKSFDQKLSVVKFSDWWKGQAATDMRPLGSTLYRSAFNDPAIQIKWEDQYGKVEWQRAAAADVKPSTAVRQIISELRSSAG
jgi:hypothetical protein